MPSKNVYTFHSLKSIQTTEGVFSVVKYTDGLMITTAEDLELFLTLEVDDKVNMTIIVSNNCILHLGLISKSDIEVMRFQGTVNENAELSLYFADFSKKKSDFHWNVDLNGKNAKGTVKVASISSGTDVKDYDILINHHATGTYGLTDCYGVAKDKSHLSFIGNGHIFNGMKDSSDHQNCRIMVFDEEAKGLVKPILTVDENDISAGHSASLGTINPDHMFYMTSRGLSESIAKEIIAYGYLYPILDGFNEEENRDYISDLIREKMS